MKQLPDENTLLSLLKIAQDAEQKAKDLCDLTAGIDEKWQVRFDSKSKVAIQKSNSESI
jgi:hypothetical protein